MNLKYITRLHYKSSHGWWVRIRFANIQKAFSDRACGSKTKALEEAIKFRDETLRDRAMKGLPTVRRQKGYLTKPTVINKTGFVGVSCQTRKAADGTLNKYYTGSYYPRKYKSRAKAFAVNVYGEREALRRAVAFRREGLMSLKMEKKQ